jgi:Domain of unknown function (DUF4276)
MTTRVFIVCEGRTEEAFVNRLIVPALAARQVWVSAKQIGGIVHRTKLCAYLRRLSLEDPSAWITTCLDLYGLPRIYVDGVHAIDPLLKAQAIEAAINREVDRQQVRAHLAVHEFEAWLFSDPRAFATRFPDAVPHLEAIAQRVPSPEHINDDPVTAPSKRILSLMPTYSKVNDGVIIAQDIGLPRIRERCRHFDTWLTWLESLA